MLLNSSKIMIPLLSSIFLDFHNFHFEFIHTLLEHSIRLRLIITVIVFTSSFPFHRITQVFNFQNISPFKS